MGEPALKGQERYTYKDLREWPEGERWELVGGEAYQISSPSTEHQRVLGALFVALFQGLNAKPCEPFLAPLDVSIFRLVEGRFEAPSGANLSRPVEVGLFPGLVLQV